MDPNDPSILIFGANTFDLAADAQKEYKLTFTALKQSQSKI